MGRVKVRLYGDFRSLAAKKELELEIEGPVTIRELVKQIPHLKERLSRAGELGSQVLFFVSNQICSPEDMVREGDTVHILPPLSGG